MNLRDLVLIAGAAAAFLSYMHWREALRLFMTLVVLEGAIRKWVLPEAQDLVYFGKDVLLLGIFLGFLDDRSRRRVTVPPLLGVAFTAGAFFAGLQALNPRLPNLLVGILGFKAYFLYVPLVWIVPAAFRSSEELGRFLRAYALLAVPVGLVGIAQFMSAPDALINAYARTGETGAGSATFGSSTHVRITGTFSYITGYSSYLMAVTMLVLASLTATRWRFRGNALLYLALALSLLSLMMSGSRGPVLILALLFPLYWWLGVARESVGGDVAGRVLLGLGLIAVLLNYAGADAIGAFYGRAQGSEDILPRMAAPFLSPFVALDQVGLMGYGTGATHQAAEALTRGIEPYSWLDGLLVEDEPGRVMIELGPLGFALVYLVRVALVALALKQVFRLRSVLHRAVATCCALFFLSSLPGGVIFNVTADVYYWFFAGLLLLVIQLERREVPKATGRRTLAEAALHRVPASAPEAV